MYCDSTLVRVKDANVSIVCKWFDSSQGVVKGRDNVNLHRAGGKLVG